MNVKYNTWTALISVLCLSSNSSFLPPASALLLREDALHPSRHVVVRTWGNEHASLQLVPEEQTFDASQTAAPNPNYFVQGAGGADIFVGPVDQTLAAPQIHAAPAPVPVYISLHKSNTAFGDVWQPSWALDENDDVERMRGNPDGVFRLFSLNREAIKNRLLSPKKPEQPWAMKHVYYHPHGDVHQTDLATVHPHNCASLIVELLKEGGIVERPDLGEDREGLLEINQAGFKWSTAGAAGKAAGTALVIGGAVLAAPAAAGAAGAAAVGGGLFSSWLLDSVRIPNPTRRATREVRAFGLDGLHSQWYGHPVLAPRGSAGFGTRQYEITVHQLKDLMRKARVREQNDQVRPTTVGWR